MSNINGYCPHCKVDFDGELIVDTFLAQGKTEEESIKIAQYYAGWKQHGEMNKWSNSIGLSDWDNNIGNKCPHCYGEFKEALRSL